MPQTVRNNGMTSAAAAMQMLERRQQVLSNNLANASTHGFKSETPFARIMGDAVAVTDAGTDMTQGALIDTHNPLDLGIAGQGFFVIRTAAGERHIRGGSFQLDADHHLVDDTGNRLLGTPGEPGNPYVAPDGTITMPEGEVSISNAGVIEVTSAQGGSRQMTTKHVATLRLESVDVAARLVHEGGTTFLPDASRKPMPVGERQVQQGKLEESNVNTMATMTDMLEVMHRYTAAQKSIATLDAVRGIAVNDLAKPL